ALDAVGRVSQSDAAPLVLNKDEVKTQDVSPDPRFQPAIRLDLKWLNSPSGEPRLRIDPAVSIIYKDNNQQTETMILKNQTEVELKDNTTVVIGGLMREEEITKMHKFPVLGNLPLLGLVFRKQGKLMQKTETMIFLTIQTNNIAMPSEEGK
ncbi:MAG: hypothetical protein HQL15_08015, partial [Candidatus Omnitrophica bacterium]|nr:hypothetical protein [Candidatus Omnitrophota bacterium]